MEDTIYQTLPVTKGFTTRPLLPGPPPTQPHPPSSYSASALHLTNGDAKHFGKRYRGSLFRPASTEENARRNPDDELEALKEELALSKYENHLRCNLMASLEIDKIALQVQFSDTWGELEDTLEKLRRMKEKGPKESEKCLSCEGTGWRELRPWKVPLDEVDVIFKDTLKGLLLHVNYTKKMIKDIKGWLATRDGILDNLRSTKAKEVISIIQRVNTKLQGIERKVGKIEEWCVGQADIIDKLRAQVEARNKTIQSMTGEDNVKNSDEVEKERTDG